MAKIKTDEKLREEYSPKLKAFMDERLTYEISKRLYRYLKPYHYDVNGAAINQAMQEVKKAEDLGARALKSSLRE